MTERKTIYLDDALEAIRKLPNAGIHWFVSAEAVFDALLKLPSAQPEVRTQMSSADCISRQAAIDAIHREARLAGGTVAIKYADMFQEPLLGLPSAQPKPKPGKWLPYLPEGLRYKCSECGSRFETPWHFCPHCGSYNGGDEE